VTLAAMGVFSGIRAKSKWHVLIDITDLGLEALNCGFARESFTADSHEYVLVTRPPTARRVRTRRARPRGGLW
jgi:hypothetical protein